MARKNLYALRVHGVCRAPSNVPGASTRVLIFGPMSPEFAMRLANARLQVRRVNPHTVVQTRQFLIQNQARLLSLLMASHKGRVPIARTKPKKRKVRSDV